MEDSRKTKKQLIEELKDLRNRARTLENKPVAAVHRDSSLNAADLLVLQFLEIAEVIMVAIAPDQTVTMINRKGCEVFGYDNEEVVGRNWFDHFLPASIREQVRNYFVRLINCELEAEDYYENLILTKDGQERLIAWHNAYLRDKDGNILGTLSSGLDITEKRQIEYQLQESEASYRELFEANPHPMWIFDVETLSFLEVNNAAVHKYGYPRDEFLSMTIKDIRPPEDVPALMELLSAHTSGIDPGLGTVRHRRKDGSIILVEITSHILEYKDRRADMIVAYDVTERVETQEALIRSEERFRAIFEQAAVGVAQVETSTGRFLRVNRKHCDIVGLSEKEMTATTFMDITHPEDLQEDLDNMKALIDGRIREFSMEKRYYKKDGSIVWVNLTVSPLWEKGDDPSTHIGIVEDITARKNAEQALRGSEERLRTLFRTIPDAIVISRMADGMIADVNDGFRALTGIDRLDAIGKTDLDLRFWDNSVDRERLIAAVEKHGRVENMEIHSESYSVDPIDISITSRKIILDDEPHMITIVRDITARKHSERRLRASLAEKETLLREVHHRVKNNLHSILGMLDLKTQLVSDSQAARVLKDSRDRILSMALIHKELYSAEDLAHIDFGKYVKALAEHLLASYSRDPGAITVDVDIEGITLNPDTAIPCGLIINELISNSLVHAFPDGGRGTISVFMAPCGEDYCLTVKDDGAGMPEDFDIETLETMGLVIVKSIVNQLAGTMEIDREGGTTFDIMFKVYYEASSLL